MRQNGDDGLTGSVPDFAGLPRLTELFLNQNSLNGSLPLTFLQNVTVSEKKVADLSTNRIIGPIPANLSRFTAFDLYLSDNMIDTIPPEICALSWNGGKLAGEGCDHILCGKSTFNSLGRATSDLACLPCTNATSYLGSTHCGENPERNILEDFFVQLDGFDWTYSDRWLTRSDICTWYGITCWNDSSSKDGFVRSISFEENGMKGPWPSSIFELEFLESLVIKNNSIEVSFEGIESASLLKTLDLSGMDVVTLDGIGKAKSLQVLHLTSSKLILEISHEIYSLTNLVQLYLDYNELVGPLSTQIGQLSALKELYLSHNLLSSEIPSEIGKLSLLEVLELSHCQFSGVLPSQLGTLSKLRVLTIERETVEDGPGKGMEGPLPTFEKMTNLEQL
jgi:Leucine-rich repeat (LRR) protein